MKIKLKNWQYDCICIAVILAAVTIMLSWIYSWGKIDMGAPFYYGGGDEMSGLVNAKLFETSGNNLETDRLGAPFGTAYYDFPASLMHNFDLLTLKICVKLSGDAVTGNNINIYLMFYLSAIISFFVMKELKVKRLPAVLGSIAFAFTPFVQSRITGHTQLAECYFIPLSILLCVWLYERDDIFCFNKQFFKNPRNYFAILFIILIGNNGIAYYPFFTCYLLVVTAVAKWIKTRRLSGGLKCIMAVAGIGLMLVINMLPYIFYVRENGSVEAAVRQPLIHAETYGMKITQLFMPMNASGNTYVADIMNRYNSNAPLVNENVTSYIGIIGVVGFVLLLLVLLVKSQRERLVRLRFLSQLNIFMVFLAAGNGIGTMFSYFVSPMIRGYNRASVFIAYISILGICLFLSELAERYNRYVVAGVSTAFMVFGIWEQSMPIGGQLYNVSKYYSDKEFFETMENSVEKESMIFTLPYHIYPEGGSKNDMPQDALFAGMILTDTLKFSYGGVVGRQPDIYCAETAAMPVKDMVEKLKKDGFAGIYIDRRAYTEDDLNTLENQLSQITGSNIIVSKNGDLSFFKFK